MSKLKRSYAAFGRLSHKAIAPFLKLYLGDKHIRVRVLIINEQKEVLLVKNWLGHQSWSLPGGGIKRTETPAEAAAREVYEETGLRLAAGHLQELGTFRNEDAKGRYTFTVACYIIEIAKRVPRLARRRRLEVLDLAWFPINNLPQNISLSVKKALELRKA